MMRTKTVAGADGRSWELRRNIEWSPPVTGDEFEHDVDSGRGGTWIVFSGLSLFWVALLAWLGSHVHIPWFLWLVALVVVGFFPVRWYLRRPWTVVAETEGSYQDELPAERWTGLVRGGSRAREEMRVAQRSLRTRATPGHSDSPLQQVN